MNYRKLKKLELIECCEKFDTQVTKLKEEKDEAIKIANDKILSVHKAKINAESKAETYKQSNMNLIKENKELYMLNDKLKNINILIIIVAVISAIINIVLIVMF